MNITEKKKRVSTLLVCIQEDDENLEEFPYRTFQQVAHSNAALISTSLDSMENPSTFMVPTRRFDRSF